MKYKLGGEKLESQADIPDDLRRELYAEADNAFARKRNLRAISPIRSVPVTVNNHFPEQPIPGSSSTGVVSASEHRSAEILSPVVITDHHDTAVYKYSKWLQSRYHGTVYKEAVAAAERLVQQRILGLDHIYEDRNWQFLVDEGIPMRVARRFVCDVKLYFKHLRSE